MNIEALFTKKRIGINELISQLTIDKLNIVFSNSELTPLSTWKDFCKVLDLNICGELCKYCNYKQDDLSPNGISDLTNVCSGNNDFDNTLFLRMLLNGMQTQFNSDKSVELFKYCMNYFITLEKFKMNNNIDFQEVCSICHDNLSDDLVKLPCGHIFHSDCILEWFKKKNNCPYCTNKIYDDNQYKEELFWNLVMDCIYTNLYTGEFMNVVDKYINCFNNISNNTYKNTYSILNENII